MKFSRRAVMALPAAALAHPAAAEEESFAQAERAILAGRTPIASGIVIDMPLLSENGNSVDLALRIASPMTTEDHITTIHILAERNPEPRVARFTLSPRAGRAEIATRIRAATTQTILVLAETILGACVDGG